MKIQSLITAGLLALGVTSALAAGVPQGSITLRDYNVALCYHNDTTWSLSKDVISVDDVIGDPNHAKTVNWLVTATKGATTPNSFTVYGYLTVENTGSGTATIGNIIINLQKSPGACQTPGAPWVSAAANVSTAILGDAGNTANIVGAGSQESASVNACSGLGNYAASGGVGTFDESAGSGTLQFFNSEDNSLWALNNPADRNLAPGEIVHLLYKATFDASAPGMPAAGAPIRIEALVTFGNAGARGGSGASVNNVDIDMDGLVNGQTGQTDEDNVRTVPTRSTTTMPGLANCNATVNLADSSDAVTLTPNTGTGGSANTITLISASADIDANISATATAPFSVTLTGGQNGGEVCNTATLVGSDYNLTLTIFTNGGFFQVYEPCCTKVNKSASSCIQIEASVAPPEGCTFTQGGWGAKANGYNPGALLANNFNTVYPNGVTIGGAKTVTFKTVVTGGVKKVKGKLVTVTSTVYGWDAIELYLPAGKTPGQLTANCTNPDKTSAGVLGGQILALQLNVDFGNAGLISPVGGLFYCAGDLPSIQGKTISQILAAANLVLGGASTGSAGFFQQDGVTPMTLSQLNDLITNFNEGFDECTVKQWALDHLCN